MLAALAAIAIIQLPPNTLSKQETKDGWKLLFDGKSTDGWTNFKSDRVGAGWKVENGILTCSDPATAGDIISKGQYEWFELMVDFRMTPGSNSGIMFRVANEGDAPWHSGPEVQIYDNKDPGAENTGYLYQLYKPTVDVVKPAGEWNQFRIVVAKEKCETYLNGTKLYDYVLGSDDFKARVAKSKFKDMPLFGKVPKGHIAIQGDHGVVSFRNVKIKAL